MDVSATTALLLTDLPELEAIYLFGSQASGDANESSDIDLALLNPDPIDPLTRWNLSSRLADSLKKSVDLINLRTASTVMQHEIISKGRCIWQRDSRANLFETVTFSQYWDFNRTRAGLLKDIQERGTVYRESNHDR